MFVWSVGAQVLIEGAGKASVRQVLSFPEAQPQTAETGCYILYWESTPAVRMALGFSKLICELGGKVV